ncbi:MAG: CDP-alcohol phosphatidyltransferase family protein [Methylobacter sp.]|uniref:CDP-alcohol phosphatidyltransferase family protein n=1 Tax=Methylobacter sp. TaxID=2051955 RepID=UPI0025E816E8|nr:CDP-alcohol phosphatidyltransferase family protein [Methylobacter sp.]MCK9622963.1 CDP-alcohol phosphatidyltransferase family protein [Methylobacter sp.]
MNGEPSKLNLPNFLTGFRFVAAPVLLWLAWNGYGIAFMGLLAVAFLTDMLDGMVARMTGQVTQFGATLDSWADVITYLTIALCCWWLWPEIVRRELFYVGLIIASCLLPALAGILKFGRFTSYHTWGVKIAAASMGLTLYILFLYGLAWPFRIAAVICILAAIEEIVITWLLPEPESNLRSAWDVLKRSMPSRHQR